jgi:hypothetical protein
MNTTATIVIIAVAVLLAIILAIVFSNRKKSSTNLHAKYGSEYDYTMERTGNKKSAENSLKERERRVSKMGIKSLDQSKRNHYLEEWQKIQSDFVDDPSKAAGDANRLITEVMIVRGFPVADFDQRAADISVMYPDFVTNYRTANTVALKNKEGGASTEELRQAMVSYRTLFNELLGTSEDAVEKTF